MTPGYEALAQGKGFVDLSDRGRIRVTGEDRARLLHAMSTNHVQGMKPGESLYAFFLNAQGQIQADAWIVCYEDHFLLDVEPRARVSLYEHLDRYIIADDVTLEDITDQTYCLASPQRTYGPVERKKEVIAELLASGMVEATAEDAEAFRIAHFIPRFGHDITDRSLPQETRQMQAVHVQKGCYLGQEIVERVRSRGHVNKVLTGFTGDSEHAPEVGAKVVYGGKEDGEVTSSVAIDGHFYGLAIVRAQIANPGTAIGIEGRPATLTALGN